MKQRALIIAIFLAAFLALGMKYFAANPFEPLQPYIVYVVVFVVSLILKFLASTIGLNVDPGTWLDGLAYAIGAAITLLLNEFFLHLPGFVQPFVPLVVQAILLWLSSLGIKLALAGAQHAKATRFSLHR